MNFEQAYTALECFINANNDLFSDLKIENAFGNNKPTIADWKDENNLGVLSKGDGIGNKSGIYIFETLEGEILYIGKAGQNNLHERTWDHLATPELLTTDKQRTYPRHKFKNSDVKYTDTVKNGVVKLRIITVSNSLYVSLLEVYLQTLHCRLLNKLPAFNQQIG